MDKIFKSAPVLLLLSLTPLFPGWLPCVFAQPDSRVIHDLKQSNEILNKKLNKLNQTVNDLKMQYEKVPAGMDSLETQALKEKLRAAQKELKDKEKIIQDVNQKRAVISKELIDLKKAAQEPPQELTHVIIKPEPVNYENMETQRVIKLQEENRFMAKRLKRMSEKFKKMQAELLSVRNAYMEREDIVPRAINEVRSEYEERIQVLEKEIKRLNKEITLKIDAYDAVHNSQQRIQGHLTRAETDKGKYLARIEELENRLNEQKNRLAENENFVKERKQEFSRLSEDAKKLEKRLKEQEAASQSAQAELKTSQKEFEDAQAKIDAQIKKQEEETKHLKSALAKKNEESVHNKEKIAQLTAEQKQWQKKDQDLTEKYQKQANEISAFKKGQEAYEKEKAVLTQNLSDKEEESARELALLKKVLEEERAVSREKLNALTGELAAQNKKLEKFDGQEDFQRKLEIAKKEIQDLAKKLKSETTVNQSLNANLIDAKKQLQHIQQERMDFSQEKEDAYRREVRDFKLKEEALRAKVQEKELELKELFRENELLLSELVSSKDERVVLNNQVLELNKQLQEKQELFLAGNYAGELEKLEEKMARLTRELLETENTIYEKELIIEDLRREQGKISRALDISQENNQLLKEQLEGVKINEVSYSNKDSVLDLELNKLEERVERQLRNANR